MHADSHALHARRPYQICIAVPVGTPAFKCRKKLVDQSPQMYLLLSPGIKHYAVHGERIY